MEEGSNNKIYFKSERNKDWKELKGFNNLTISTIETEENIDSFVDFSQVGPISLDLDYESKRIKKKRLIKLLMSENFSRNEAYKIAENVWKQKEYYDIFDITLAKIGVYWL